MTFRYLKTKDFSRMYKNIFFFEPSEKLYETPLKIGNLYLNRFTIDENTAFEILPIYELSHGDASVQRMIEKVME